LFDHIEVEDDAAEEFQSVPEDPSPAVKAQQQPPKHESVAFPQNTAPSRYVCVITQFHIQNVVYVMVCFLSVRPSMSVCH